MLDVCYQRFGYLLLVVFHLVIGNPYYHGNWKEKTCSSVIDQLKNQRLEVPIPPKIKGQWTSFRLHFMVHFWLTEVDFAKFVVPSGTKCPPAETLNTNGEWTSFRCEVRPGPEFLLRKYIFKSNRFHIHQYYYSDPGCNIPMYGILAEGTFKLLQASWIVPGGMEAKYHLRNVSVIPYNTNAITLFSKQKLYGCKELKRNVWRINKIHQILNFPPYRRYRNLRNSSKDFDCTRSFNFTLHELQLMRLEIRHYKKINRRMYKHYSYLHKKRTKTVKELYLGDMHTDKHRRQYYRPTSYQEPLRLAKTRRCPVCRKVANSNDYHPPRLNVYKTSLLNLPGDWESIKCETRQYGQFLIRHLKFLPDGKSWQGQYHFFQDPSCSQSTFSLDVKGNYVRGRKSHLIPGSHEFNFRITRLKVTPKNKQTTDSLNYFNGYECGIPKSWKVNVQQDVTSTGGCLTLGITLPNVEFEIMKMEVDSRRLYLYVGKRPSDGNSMRTPNRRPTAFQPPLVKCKDHMMDNNNVVIARYQQLQNLIEVPVNNTSLMNRSTIQGLLFMLLLVVVLN